MSWVEIFLLGGGILAGIAALTLFTIWYVIPWIDSKWECF